MILKNDLFKGSPHMILSLKPVILYTAISSIIANNPSNSYLSKL
jgi:hypothetical protein